MEAADARELQERPQRERRLPTYLLDYDVGYPPRPNHPKAASTSSCSSSSSKHRSQSRRSGSGSFRSIGRSSRGHFPNIEFNSTQSALLEEGLSQIELDDLRQELAEDTQADMEYQRLQLQAKEAQRAQEEALLAKETLHKQLDRNRRLQEAQRRVRMAKLVSSVLNTDAQAVSPEPSLTPEGYLQLPLSHLLCQDNPHLCQTTLRAFFKPRSQRNMLIASTYGIPRPTLPYFESGRESDFALLKMALDNLLSTHTHLSEQYKYQVLLGQLKHASALQLAKAHMYHPQPYTTALKALQDKYGQPRQLVQSELGTILSMPAFKPGDFAAFDSFALAVQSLVGMLRSLEGHNSYELMCGSHVDRLLSKMPPHLRDSFVEYCLTRGILQTVVQHLNFKGDSETLALRTVHRKVEHIAGSSISFEISPIENPSERWKFKHLPLSPTSANRMTDPQVGESEALELDCKICYSRYNATNRRPKVLQCEHRVCGRCVERLLLQICTTGDVWLMVTCPFCRQETKIRHNELWLMGEDTRILSVLIKETFQRKKPTQIRDQTRTGTRDQSRDQTVASSGSAEVLLSPASLSDSDCLLITVMEVPEDSSSSLSMLSAIYRPPGSAPLPLSKSRSVPRCLVGALCVFYFSSLPLGIYLLMSSHLWVGGVSQRWGGGVCQRWVGVALVALVPVTLVTLVSYAACHCLIQEAVHSKRHTQHGRRLSP
uniref:E3 ubiquitin-protein ligase RNF182 n=1 Tax=Knipowitschia caucasica TaxID=637954 RepID=A0AAV2MID6_KNICA